MKTKWDNDVTNRTGLVYIETKLNCRDLSDEVQSMMKTIKDTDMTYRIGVVYIKNETKLS